MKIILIGFMGSGKTSVAQKLTHLLNIPVVEMDDKVLQKTRTKNMHEVFFQGGEKLLRQTEIAIAREYAAADHTIISTGGGVVMNKIVLDYLKKNNGQVFFLNAAFTTIVERLREDQSRPLFKDSPASQLLYQFRQPLYLKYAHHVVDVNKKTIEEIAQEISYTAQEGRMDGK